MPGAILARDQKRRPHSKLGQDSIGHGNSQTSTLVTLNEQNLDLWFFSSADDQLVASLTLGRAREWTTNM